MGMAIFYLREIAIRAFTRSIGRGDLVGSLVGNAATVWAHADPSWQSTVNDFAWQIPVFALSGAMMLRLLYSPYELWLEQKARADAAERSELPGLSLKIENIIHGGKIPNMEYTAFVLQLKIKNLGRMPSSISYSDWDITISGGDASSDLKILNVGSRDIVLGGYLGSPVKLEAKDSLIKQMEQPLTLGDIRHGFIACVIDPSQQKLLSKGDVVRVTAKDVLEKEICSEWVWGDDSRFAEIPYMPFASEVRQ